MSKKETNEIELIDIDLEDLKFLKEDGHKTTEEEEEKQTKKNQKVKIQTIEEYFLELGYSPDAIPQKIKKDYPDLFTDDLEKKQKDDVMSECPGLETSPGLLMYASLLVVKHENK